MHRGANSLLHHDDDNRVNNTCNYRRKSCICKFKYILFLRRHVKKTKSSNFQFVHLVEMLKTAGQSRLHSRSICPVPGP